MLKRPLIGVTAGFSKDDERYHSISRSFMEALTSQGAMAVMLPAAADEALLRDYAATLDGVLFSGGVDVDPMLFGEYQHPACGAVSPLRDAHELALARILLQRGDKPVFGVCRGVQLLNIALGGDIYQDLPSQYTGECIAHRQKQPSHYASHPVEVTPGSLLERITGCTRLMVNSLHHQALRRVEGWNVCASAPDGVIEAAEMQGHPFFLGVQWHPEILWRQDDAQAALFAAFTSACGGNQA